MPPAVRCDLVTGIGNPANDPRIRLGDPPETEKGDRRGVLIEKGEDRVQPDVDTRRVRRPIPSRYHSLERVDLEVLLHVDREDVRMRSGVGSKHRIEWGSGRPGGHSQLACHRTRPPRAWVPLA